MLRARSPRPGLRVQVAAEALTSAATSAGDRRSTGVLLLSRSLAGRLVGRLVGLLVPVLGVTGALDRDKELTLKRGTDGLPIIPAAAASADGLLIRFAAYSGLRVGELSGLQVRDLDLDEGVIHVQRANAEVAGKLVPGLPKGNKTRTVDLAPHLVPDLAAHVEGKAPTDLVFVGATGAPLRRSNLNKRMLAPAAALAGISAEDRMVTVHALRHTFASICASAGIRIEIVSRWMGHASVAITQRVYVGLFREDLSASAGLLSGVATAAAPKLRVVG